MATISAAKENEVDKLDTRHKVEEDRKPQVLSHLREGPLSSATVCAYSSCTLRRLSYLVSSRSESSFQPWVHMLFAELNHMQACSESLQVPCCSSLVLSSIA